MSKGSKSIVASFRARRARNTCARCTVGSGAVFVGIAGIEDSVRWVEELEMLVRDALIFEGVMTQLVEPWTVGIRES